MIDPEKTLFIYEIKSNLPDVLPDPPNTLIGVWNEDDFSYVFFLEPEDHYVEGLCSSCGANLSSRHEMRYKDWQEGIPDVGLSIAGQKFVPFRENAHGENSIFLDPSVVFGDGNHPTTVACIEFLVDIMKKDEVKSALDLGSGSGILALTAARLGASKVVAADKNRLAVQATRLNVSRNGFDDIIETREGEARIFLNRCYDLVMANLPFSVLRDIVVLKETTLVKTWVVSGINSDQALTLKTLLEEQGFEIKNEKLTPPWTTFVAAQKDME